MFFLINNSKVSQNIERLVQFFEMHHLPLTPTKLKLSFFAEEWKNVQIPVGINVKCEKFTSSNSVKCLSVTLNRYPTYQEELKIISGEMIVGMKTLHTICSIYSEQTKLFLLKSINQSFLKSLSITDRNYVDSH